MIWPRCAHWAAVGAGGGRGEGWAQAVFNWVHVTRGLLAQLPAADGDLSFLSFASDEVHGPPDRHSRPGGALPG